MELVAQNGALQVQTLCGDSFTLRVASFEKHLGCVWQARCECSYGDWKTKQFAVLFERGEIEFETGETTVECVILKGIFVKLLLLRAVAELSLDGFPFGKKGRIMPLGMCAVLLGEENSSAKPSIGSENVEDFTQECSSLEDDHKMHFIFPSSSDDANGRLDSTHPPLDLSLVSCPIRPGLWEEDRNRVAAELRKGHDALTLDSEGEDLDILLEVTYCDDFPASAMPVCKYMIHFSFYLRQVSLIC